MKNKFYSTQIFSLLKKSGILLFLVVALGYSGNAQFLKTYHDVQNPSAPVYFECITPTPDGNGNFFIGGHIGSNIALFKVDQSGNMLATHVITNAAVGSRLDGIIFDNAGDIVVIGNVETASTIQGFVFKFKTATSTVAWFRKENANNLVGFYDISLIPGSQNYRISGSNGLSSFIHGAIFNVTSITGSISPTPFSDFIVNGVEEAAAIQIFNNKTYVTGRYTIGVGSSTFRQALSRFSSAGAHLGSKYYLVNSNTNARMYSTDMLMTKKDGVICGWGDDNGQNVFENLTLTKVKGANGNMIWAKKYDDLNQTFDGTFNEIHYDNGVKNYVIMGYRFTNALDEAFLVYTDSSGSLLWSNKYPFFRHPTALGENHQYVFAVNAGFIYAIGQKPNSANISEGTLLKVSTANGMLNDVNGGACSDSLSFKVIPYTFNANVTPTLLPTTFPSAPFTAQQAVDSLEEKLICGSDCPGDTVNLGDVGICQGGHYDICNQTFTQNGFYTVTCPGDNGCPQVYTFIIYTSSLIANAGPNGSVGGCCTTTLNGSASGGTPGYTYSWSPTTGLLPPYNIPNPTCSAPGTYLLTVTDASGCISTDVVVIGSGPTCCRSSSNGSAIQDAHVFPNPSSGDFTIEVSGSETAKLIVYNEIGQMVESFDHVGNGFQFGKDLAEGIYHVSLIYVDGKTEQVKLMKNAR